MRRGQRVNLQSDNPFGNVGAVSYEKVQVATIFIYRNHLKKETFLIVVVFELRFL